MTRCFYCGAEKDCRPYGVHGEMICFKCAFATPEKKRQTEEAFARQLNASGDAVVIGTEAGPFPLEHLGLKP